ncbi:hypothetical protein J6TS7_29850 [Paenibacillus dendritiformis]|nr:MULTISPECIES: hypothetical protein [Paenibacillus]MEB9896734.1 hypothetical protein [Bacillus cereus]GIO79375.1 hypothetical protein J6TS7_29850 [Paenibacillus dendritiformis]
MKKIIARKLSKVLETSAKISARNLKTFIGSPKLPAELKKYK